MSKAKRFLRSKRLRAVLYRAADGKCQICGCELPESWHADHVIPYRVSGRTNVHEMQSLCQICNTRKGKKMPLKVVSRKFFKDTRREFMAAIESRRKELTLLIECGAGKSSLPPALLYDGIKAGVIDSVLWLAPRSQLARQAAKSFQRTGFVWKLLGVPPADAARFEINDIYGGNPSAGVDPAAGTVGYATSYAGVASFPELHFSWIDIHKTLVVLDEIQLFEVGSPTGILIEKLKSKAAFTLMMSGDFDRGGEVAGVVYEATGKDKNHRVVSVDVEYTIYDAFKDRAIIPPVFEYGQGDVSFVDTNGEVIHYPSIENAPLKHGNEIVAAVVEEGYATDLLGRCIKSWRSHTTTGLTVGESKRPPQKDAQLLVVCGSQSQANRCLRICIDNKWLSNAEAKVVTSETANDTELLNDFTEGRFPVAFTVAKAYIGMDAVAISHLCCLTNYRTPSWLHQMLARMWRLNPRYSWAEQFCVVFCPNDPKFRQATQKIKDAVQAGVKDKGEGPGPGPGDGGSTEHTAKINYQDPRFEFVKPEWDDDWGPVDDNEQLPGDHEPEEVDAEGLREMLLSNGMNGYEIDSMIAALHDCRAGVQKVEVVYETRTPSERMRELAKELESYQRETAKMLEKKRGGSGKVSQSTYIAVNGKLAAVCGHTREKVKSDESLLRECIAKHAPYVRRSMLR